MEPSLPRSHQGSKTLSPTGGSRAAIRILDLADGRRVLAVAAISGRPVVLVSLPGAAGFAGAGWWAALTAALRAEYPHLTFTALLDCDDAPGHVLGALRAGVTDIAFTGPDAVAAKLADIAGQQGARLHPRPNRVLELRGLRDPDARIADWLEAPGPDAGGTGGHSG